MTEYRCPSDDELEKKIDSEDEVMEKERIIDEELEAQSDSRRKNEDGTTKLED